MIYSIPYIALVAVIGFAALYYESEQREDRRLYVELGCVGLFFVFFAFRGYISTDWTSYYNDFQKVELEYIWTNSYTSDTVSWRLEPGFTLLLWLCKSLTNSFISVNVVCAVITTILLMRFLRQRLDNPLLGLLLYVCFGGLMLNINLLRNAISILIFVNALPYIQQRRFVPFALLMLLGMMFHFSAVFYLFTYFFLHRRTPVWLFAAVVVVGHVVLIGKIPIFLGLVSLLLGDVGRQIQFMIEGYTSGQMEEAMSVLSIGNLERLFTICLILAFYRRLQEMREDSMLFINSYLIYVSLFLFFSEFRTLALRFSYLFFFAYWILWADLIRCFAIRNNRRLFLVFVGLYCVLKMHGQTNVIEDEYDNVLFGAKSYEERLYIFNRNYDES